jgi:diguanylate cyclase (GGDEF)-like protein
VAVGIAAAGVMLAAAALAVDSQAVIHETAFVLIPFTAVISVMVLSTALVRSDLAHRSEAVLDELTGMLNRHALATRVAELTEQSGLTGAPIGLIVGDVDHFKAINDARGHATGDAVLRDLGYVLRKRLRAFDFAYRIGGEEFAVLLPGADLDQASALAQQLRRAVADEAIGGMPVTMSFGVGASEPGKRLNYDVVYAQADRALYEAKRNGRNRVCSAAPHVRSPRLPFAAYANVG